MPRTIFRLRVASVGLALIATLISALEVQGQSASADSAAGPLARPNGAFFALSVADVARMTAWYREHLGLHVTTQGTAAGETIRFALLEGDGTVVELIQRSDARPLSALAPGVAGAHLVHGFFKAGLNVRDIDKLYDQLRAAGVAIAYPLERAKDLPLRSFSVRDPEGNLIQFFGR